MVESMDAAVGRLMRTLDDAGVADNTIVVFFSDNGGVFWNPGAGMLHPEYREVPITSNAPLRGGKATVYEGGTREPCVVVWPGRVKPGSRSDEVISSIDFFPTLLEMTGVKPAAAAAVRRHQRDARPARRRPASRSHLLPLPPLHPGHRQPSRPPTPARATGS